MSIKKKTTFWIVGILIILASIAVSIVAPIDDTPLREQDFYKSMMKKLDTLEPEIYQSSQPLKVGWSKINITPKGSTPMVGYKPRDHFESVHDSLFVRVLLFDNGSAVIPLVSADLLLFPPALKSRVLQNKPGNITHIYFGATHTHNSIGGWDNSAAGQIIAGNYDDQLIIRLSEAILQGIKAAYSNALPANIEYFKQNANQYVENRLDRDHGKTDGWLRGMNIERTDHSKASFITYSAHPTNITQSSLALSGDYPAMLIKSLEDDHNINFAMFIAGMVGSHRLTGIDGKNFVQIKNAGKTLGELIPPIVNDSLADTVAMRSMDVKIEYGPSQLRIGKNWKIRNWVFDELFGPLRGDLNIIQIGNIILLGTPCDFSGELYVEENIESLANESGLHPVVTSFNGNYTGYIIYDEHYSTSRKEEATTMNWVGPHYGQYFSEIIRKCLLKFSTTNN